MFNTTHGGIATGVHYAGHGLIGNNASSCFIGPCDSTQPAKTFAGTPLTATYTNGVEPPGQRLHFYNAGGKDTNAIWINPSTGSFRWSDTARQIRYLRRTLILHNSGFQMSDIWRPSGFARSRGFGRVRRCGDQLCRQSYPGQHAGHPMTGGPEFTDKPPASTSVNLSQNVSISGAATAAGQSVTYQWQQVVGGVTNNVNNGTGGAGGPALVSGATTGTLTLMGFGGGDVGTYQLAATASGAGFSPGPVLLPHCSGGSPDYSQPGQCNGPITVALACRRQLLARRPHRNKIPVLQ